MADTSKVVQPMTADRAYHFAKSINSEILQLVRDGRTNMKKMRFNATKKVYEDFKINKNFNLTLLDFVTHISRALAENPNDPTISKLDNNFENDCFEEEHSRHDHKGKKILGVDDPWDLEDEFPFVRVPQIPFYERLALQKSGQLVIKFNYS